MQLREFGRADLDVKHAPRDPPTLQQEAHGFAGVARQGRAPGRDASGELEERGRPNGGHHGVQHILVRRARGEHVDAEARSELISEGEGCGVDGGVGGGARATVPGEGARGKDYGTAVGDERGDAGDDTQLAKEAGVKQATKPAKPL